jgi:hypothetical protein
MASCRSPSAPLDMNLAIPVFQYYLKFPGKKIKKSFEIGIFMLCTDPPSLLIRPDFRCTEIGKY